MIKVSILSLYGSDAASHRYRFLQFKKKLIDLGIDIKINSLLDNKYLKYRFFGGAFPLFSFLINYLKRIKLLIFNEKDFDLFIIHCELFPYFPFFLEKFFLPKKYVYDFDDSFHIKYKNNFFLNNKVRKVIKYATGVTAGNDYLKNYADTINSNVIKLPTTVNIKLYSKKKKIKKNNLFTIGWIGSPSTEIYLSEIIQPISDFAKEFDVAFTVIGANAPMIENVKKTNQIKWNKKNYINEIKKFDVGIMPLFDSEWTKGKCAFKLIQYMAAEIPAIGSRIGANINLLGNGRGFLVNSKIEWLSALRIIATDKKLVKKMTKKSKIFVNKFYSLESNIPKIYKIIKNCKKKKDL